MLPNWVVGPSYLVAFGILFALRIGAEERMMLEAFGDEYAAYVARTKLLVPESGDRASATLPRRRHWSAARAQAAFR